MANIHWKSGVSGDWNTGSDWVGGVPGASDVVTIGVAGSYTVTIDHSEAAQSVTLNAAGATLTESGKNVTLTLGTGLTVTAGTLSLVSALGAPASLIGAPTQAIQGGFLDVSSHGVLSVTLPSGAGSAQYSTQITSGVDLEGTTSIGTQTVLDLEGGGELAGTFAGAGEAFLAGSYIADAASFSGLASVAIDRGALYLTTSSGTFVGLSAQDSSTLSVASGLSVTVSNVLQIGQGPVSFVPEASFANVISGPGTLVTDVAEINDNRPGVTELTVGGGLTWIVGTQLTIDGGVVVNQSQGDSFTLINPTDGTVLIEQPGGLAVQQTGTDLFTNAGDLDSSGNVTIAIPLDSTGRIDPEGSLTLSGGGTLGGILDDTGTLVLDGNYTLAAGGLGADPVLGSGNLALDDGVLDIGTSSTFAGGFGTLGGNDEIITAADADFTLSGTVTIGQTAAESPNLYIGGPGTLTTLGTTTLDDAGSGVSLVSQVTWINGGSVTDDAIISLGDTTTTTDVETIVNQAGATFDIVGPDGGIVINGAGTGVFTNAGTLVRGTDSNTSTIAAAVDSTGIIDVTSGTLALTGGGTISGELDGSGTLLLSAGHFSVTSTLAGNGHLIVGAGASVTSVTVLDGNGTVSIPAGHTMSYTGSLAIGDASGGTTISGPGTLSTPGTTSIYDGGQGALELVLNGGLIWKNAGTVNDAGFGYAAYPGGSSASITNSGTFNFTSDDATLTVYDTSTADTFTNTGTLAKTAGTGTSTLGLTAKDTGAIVVSSGTLAMTGGGLVSGSLSGAGLLDLAAGTFTSTGLSSAGHLAVTGNGTTLSETASGTIASSVLVSGDGTLSASPTATIMTLSGAVAIGNAASYGVLSGPGTIATTGSTTVYDGGAGALELVVVGGVNWANGGTVNDGGFGYAAYPGGSSGSVINSGTFNFTSDDATLTVYDTSTADTFTNTGTLAKTGGTGTSLLGLTAKATGAIVVSSGTLAMTGGGLVSGSLSGAGLLDLAGGAFTSTGLSGTGHLAVTGTGTTLTETASGTIASSVLVSGDGTLAAAPKAALLTLSGPVAIGDAVSYGAFSGSGTILTTGITSVFDGGSGALEVVVGGGVTWANSGTVNDAGFGYAAYPGSPGASISNSGTFNFTSDDATLTVYDTTSTDSFTNTGTLAKTAGTGTSLLGFGVNDTGSVAVASGTLAMTGGGQVSGVLTGAGLLDLAGGAFTSTGLSGTGHLAITGAGTTLTETASGTIAASVLVSGDGTLAASPKAAILTLSGAVAIGNAASYGAFSGSGTILTTGITSVFDGGSGALELTVGGGVTWANSGTVNDAGFGYAAYPGSPGALITNSGTFNFTSDDATLTVYDTTSTDSFTNTGTLAKTGGTGTSLIGFTVNDTGTVAVASGTLAISGGGQASGVLTGAGLLDLAGGAFTSTGLSGTGHLAVTGAGTTLTETVSGTIASSVLVSGDGTLAASPKAAILTLSGPVAIGDAASYGAFSGPGTIATTGTTSIFDGGAGALELVVAGGGTWANSGTVNDAGVGYFAYPGGAGGTIANSGTFNLTSDDATLTIYDTSTTDSFSNSGTLAKTGGSGTSVIGLAITNTGTIEASHGTLSLTGGVTGTGNLKIDAGATLDIGTIPASQKIAFSGGAGATLKLETTASIGTLTNFTAGDRLDLVGNSVTSAKVTGNTLTIVSGVGTTTYVSGGLANEVAAITSDGASGSFVTLYRGAIPTHTPEPLAFGNFHVGSTTGTLLALTVTNTAPADGYSEKLNAGFGNASSGFSASGTVTGLVGGASNSTSLTAAINTGTAGAKSGTATLTLASNGAGIDGRGTTALPSQIVNLIGGVYNYAAATLGSATLNLGVIHAGTAAGAALALTNSAAAGGFSESLDAGLSGASAGLSTTGSISLLAAGQTDSTTLMLDVTTGTTGAYTGTATLGLVSDGAGTSGLGTTTLTSQTVTVTATVDNYALAALEDPGGPALTGTSTNETLNLGTVAMGGAALTASIGALNAATGLSDLLGGTFTSAGAAGFTNTGFGTFSGLSAGQDEHAQMVSLATGTAGTFTETVVLSSYGTNASGYIGALAPETLTIIGTVTASTYTTYTLASGANVIHGANGLGDVFIASAASIVSGDQLTGGTGSNSITLVGAGTFNLNAPSVFANIPTIQGMEGQAAKSGKPNTKQTIQLRNGATETLTIAAGTQAMGNSNPEAVSITAGTGTYAINLAGGADAVTLGAGSATVMLGGTSNSVTAGSGTALIHSTAAFAGASIVGSTGQTTLEVAGGGNVTLNAADTHLTVQLDSPGALKLSTMAFITGIGSSGADTLTALGGTQTLTGGAGIDSLVGYSGGNDTFADTAAGLNGDTIKGWTTGDVIDLKDIVAAQLHPLMFGSNTLTVTDGTTSSAIKFSAGLGLHSFTVLGSDGSGGTLIGFHS